jgi:hypothetical protein
MEPHAPRAVDRANINGCGLRAQRRKQSINDQYRCGQRCSAGQILLLRTFWRIRKIVDFIAATVVLRSTANSE